MIKICGYDDDEKKCIYREVAWLCWNGKGWIAKIRRRSVAEIGRGKSVILWVQTSKLD